METYGMTHEKFQEMPECKQLAWNFAAQLHDICDENTQNEMIQYVISEIIEYRSGEILSLDFANKDLEKLEIN